MIVHTMSSPIGPLRLLADPAVDALVGIYLRAQTPADARAGTAPILARAAVQLAEYFAGTRRVFDLALAPRGTEFQSRVWTRLAAIPFGETRSYGELAREVGNPNASRAVGAANGKNPLSIIVPCHRVIGTSGALTGYAGGLETKKWLLAHEAKLTPLPLEAIAAR